MAAPPSAAPPRLPMMAGLDLDEHPTRPVRDLVVAVLTLVVFGLAVLLLAR